MNALTLLLAALLTTIAAADDQPLPASESNRAANAMPAAPRESPAAEPLTLVGRGTELAIIENGELEQLQSAPPILILPEPSRPRNTPGHEPTKSDASQPDNLAAKTNAAAFSTIEQALDARRERLGRRHSVAPPPARNAGYRSSERRKR